MKAGQLAGPNWIALAGALFLCAAPAFAQPPRVDAVVVVTAPRPTTPGEVRFDAAELRLRGARTVADALAEVQREANLGGPPAVTLNGLRTLGISTIGALPVEALESVSADPSAPGGPTLNVVLKPSYASVTGEARARTSASEDLTAAASEVTPRRVLASNAALVEQDRSGARAFESRASLAMVTLGSARQASLRLEASAGTLVGAASRGDQAVSLVANLTSARAGGPTWLFVGQASYRGERLAIHVTNAELAVEGRVEDFNWRATGLPLVLGGGARFEARRSSGQVDLTDSDAQGDLTIRAPLERWLHAPASINARWAWSRASRGGGGAQWDISGDLVWRRWLFTAAFTQGESAAVVADEASRRNELGVVTVDAGGGPEAAAIVQRPLPSAPPQGSRSASVAATYQFAPETSVNLRLAYESQSNQIARPNVDVRSWLPLLPNRLSRSSAGLEVDASDAVLDGVSWRSFGASFEHRGRVSAGAAREIDYHVALTGQLSWDVTATAPEARRLGAEDVVRIFDLERADTMVSLLAEGVMGSWRLRGELSHSRRRAMETGVPRLDLELERTLAITPRISLTLIAGGEDLLRLDANRLLPVGDGGVGGRSAFVGVRYSRQYR